MPLYEYQCQGCGERSEVLQKMSDPPLETCDSCSGQLTKLISAPAFQFKGTGWYVTDYGKSGSSNDGGSKGGGGSEGGASDGGSSSGGSSEGSSSDGGSSSSGSSEGGSSSSSSSSGDASGSSSSSSGSGGSSTPSGSKS